MSFSMKSFLVALVLLGPGAASAQSVDGYRRMLARCVERARSSDRADVEACIGLVSDTCIETSDDGYSTAGSVRCVDTERALWDDYLNSEYQTAMARARAADESYGLLDPIAPALRRAQRAWITYRDANCALDMARGMGGTIGLQFAAGCVQQMTAERAIDMMMIADELR